MKKVLIMILTVVLMLTSCEITDVKLNDSQNSSSGKLSPSNIDSDANFVANITTPEPSKNSYEENIGPDDLNTSYTLSEISAKTNIDVNIKKTADDLTNKLINVLGWLMYQPTSIGIGKRYITDQYQARYFIVSNPRFSNMNDFKKYLETFMSDNLINKFLAGVNFVEYQGHLYARDGTEGGSVYGEKREYSITYQDEKTMKFDVYVSDPVQNYYKCYMNIEKVNGNWIVADSNIP